MNNKIYTIQELIEIITPIMRKYHAEQSILFGSYSRNSADSSSDIDLVIIDGTDFYNTIMNEGVRIAA